MFTVKQSLLMQAGTSSTNQSLTVTTKAVHLSPKLRTKLSPKLQIPPLPNGRERTIPQLVLISVESPEFLLTKNFEHAT